jgi:hypothetical protein
MKKSIYLGCCLLLIAIVASGLWSIGASKPSVAQQNQDTSIISRADELVQDMSLQSELILTGRCVDTSTTWVEDGRILVTLATISVDEVIKGGQISTVTVVLPGGVDLNRDVPVAMTYAGAPRIANKDEVFLFLNGEEMVSNGYSILGLSQGKFSIVEDENGQKLVSPDPIQAKVQSGSGLVRGNRPLVSLSDFKEKVKGYLGQ